MCVYNSLIICMLRVYGSLMNKKYVYPRDDLPLQVLFSMVIELVQDKDVFAILYMTRVIDICVPQDCCFAGV